MARVTPREIMQSIRDHAQGQADQGKRQQRQHVGSYTSESDRAPRPMYCRAKADPRDRYWRALGKQVRAGARITVRG